jgi:hypothetical protein
VTALGPGMKVEVTATVTATPAAAHLVVTDGEDFVEPYTDGHRVLYAFQYKDAHMRGGGPMGGGAICNECAADPVRYDAVLRHCTPYTTGELKQNPASGWRCMSCYQFPAREVLR